LSNIVVKGYEEARAARRSAHDIGRLMFGFLGSL
jgi:hypothetical protein